MTAQLQRVSRDTDITEIASIFARDGALIIEDFLTSDQVHRLNAEFDEPLRKLGPAGQLTEVPDEAREFFGVNTKRLTDLISLSKTWREEVVDDNLMHGICEEILTKGAGGYWLSTAQMIEIGPGNPKQPLHRDFSVWWPNFLMPPTAPETLVNFLIATTDTTEENGATRAIPGSHQWPYSADDHNHGSEDLTQSYPLKAGDALVIGGRIVHGGGRNSTKDFYRRILAVPVVANCFTQEEAFALIVPREEAKKMSHRVQSFLGFRSQYPKGSAGVWTKDYQDIGYQLGFGSMEGIAEKAFGL
jgi:ectoine hydroxylase-related dioxygenase (phytanoyl-CoA dioxygenase family)